MWAFSARNRADKRFELSVEKLKYRVDNRREIRAEILIPKVPRGGIAVKRFIHNRIGKVPVAALGARKNEAKRSTGQRWWRRGELNPRPEKPEMKRTTCVAGSVFLGQRFRAGKTTLYPARLISDLGSGQKPAPYPAE